MPEKLLALEKLFCGAKWQAQSRNGEATTAAH
jgi:hypothetical protein